MRVKTEAQREAIVRAAIEVFREDGYDKASMNKVSQRLGGSKGTLYNYFTSKEELFAAAMLDAISGSAAEAFRVLAETKGETLQGQLTRFGEAYLRFVLTPDSLEITRLAYQEGRKGQLGVLLYKESVQKGWDVVAEFLQSRLDAKAVESVGGWAIAMQFKALLSAELVELRLRGVLLEVPDEDIRRAAQTSALAIQTLYCVVS